MAILLRELSIHPEKGLVGITLKDCNEVLLSAPIPKIGKFPGRQNSTYNLSHFAEIIQPFDSYVQIGPSMFHVASDEIDQDNPHGHYWISYNLYKSRDVPQPSQPTPPQ